MMLTPVEQQQLLGTTIPPAYTQSVPFTAETRDTFVRYRIVHTTEYEYQDFVNLCHNQACLTPRSFTSPLLEQRCLTSQTQITPRPDDERVHTDFFGNATQYFALQKPHKHLCVTTTSLVERCSLAPADDTFLSAGESWNDVAIMLANPYGSVTTASTFATTRAYLLDAVQFVFDSPLIQPSAELRQYAEPSFSAHRPLLEAVRDLTARIHRDFQFVPGFTTISTPIAEVLRERKGVCQDFAHLALGCLRSLGLAARYVSGYIETIPPEGEERFVGADASHAWIAVFSPSLGWVEFDPTNNQLARDQHIVLGWGRDYFDVPPLKGVMLSSGATELSVKVDVMRV